MNYDDMMYAIGEEVMEMVKDLVEKGDDEEAKNLLSVENEKISVCSYWDGEGMWQALYDYLCAKHVPAFGAPSTHVGVLVWCLGRLQHDWYNNGFGNFSTKYSGTVDWRKPVCDISWMVLLLEKEGCCSADDFPYMRDASWVYGV